MATELSVACGRAVRRSGMDQASVNPDAPTFAISRCTSATAAHDARGESRADERWKTVVASPSTMIQRSCTHGKKEARRCMTGGRRARTTLALTRRFQRKKTPMVEDIDTVITEWTERLDEQERIARAAAECPKSAYPYKGDHSVWRATFSKFRNNPKASGSVSSGGVWIEDVDWDDERVVVYDEGYPTGPQAEHIAFNDPKSVLVDIAAKRKAIADYREVEKQADPDLPYDPNETISILKSFEQVIRTLAGVDGKDQHRSGSRTAVQVLASQIPTASGRDEVR